MTKEPVDLCSACSKPLARMRVDSHYRLVCDDWQCRLYREGQGNIPVPGAPVRDPWGIRNMRTFWAGVPARKNIPERR